ncbi:general transcription factor IIH subunit 1-like [Liolophura sinensis]|uniref:general transcription factor IIH subunit 1-like n=1 Tax=Liolophura sinensis TaxID=3198878 RepID=UPI0031592A88
MAKSSEDVLLIINDVRCKKTSGALYMMGERMAWMPENKNSFSCSYMYEDIKSQKISPDSRDKVQLQVVMHDGGANTFHFANPMGRDAQKQDRDGVKELLLQLLPKFRRKVSSELEEKNRLFQDDPVLYQLYKDLVVSQIITSEEFWRNRALKLASSQPKEDSQKQTVGVSAAFLADIKPETDGCNGVNYNLTADIIESIFRTYPMVKKKHAENVPYKMTESEFWTNFFQSHYFHRDRTSLSKDLFSECAKRDDEDIRKEISKTVNNSLLDLTQLKDNITDEEFGKNGEDGRSSNNLANLSLIRRFNHHSTMVLKACESQGEGPSASTSGQANGDKDTSVNNKRKGKPTDNGLQSSTSADTQASNRPAAKKVKLKNAELEDLVDEGKVQSASLRLSKMERYLHGPTPVTATTYTTGQDFLQASETVSREINQWQPQIQQSLSGTSALCVLGELSPGGALMTTTSQHQLQQMVSSQVQVELQQLYNALCELLRHFWSCFPTSNKCLEEKVVKMRATLERFENAKLQQFKDKISHSHYNVNLLGHMEAMLQAAYGKFDTWQARRQKKR